MLQEVELADSVQELLAEQDDKGELPEFEPDEGMHLDLSEEHEHKHPRQETSRSRLSSRVTRQSEVDEQNQPQAQEAQGNEQVPIYTPQEQMVRGLLHFRLKVRTQSEDTVSNQENDHSFPRAESQQLEGTPPGMATP